MKTKLHKAKLDEKEIIKNLLQLYEYDFSEYDSTDVNQHGLFRYKYLDHYWTEEGRHPFLFLTNKKISGFCFVREMHEENSGNFELAEFFILKKYRKKGIGKEMARRIFDKFDCTWNVQIAASNKPGLVFWKKVITEYTNGKYEIVTKKDWDGPIYIFGTC